MRPIETIYRQDYLDLEKEKGSQHAFFALADKMGFLPDGNPSKRMISTGTPGDDTVLVMSEHLRWGYIDARNRPHLSRDKGHPAGKAPASGQTLDLTRGYAACLHEILYPENFFKQRSEIHKKGKLREELRLGPTQPLVMLVGKRNTLRVFRMQDGLRPAA